MRLYIYFSVSFLMSKFVVVLYVALITFYVLYMKYIRCCESREMVVSVLMFYWIYLKFIKKINKTTDICYFLTVTSCTTFTSIVKDVLTTYVFFSLLFVPDGIHGQDNLFIEVTSQADARPYTATLPPKKHDYLRACLQLCTE